MQIDIYKNKLEEERARLERELRAVGQKNQDVAGDWEATPGDTEKEADPSDGADQIEEYEERSAVEFQLEERLRNVTDALARIEAGTYGTCRRGGVTHPIEEARLAANPAAETCMAHMQ